MIKHHHLVRAIIVLIMGGLLAGGSPVPVRAATRTAAPTTRSWLTEFDNFFKNTLKDLISTLNPISQKRIQAALDRAKKNQDGSAVTQITQAAKDEANREKHQQQAHYFGFASAPGGGNQTPSFAFGSATAAAGSTILQNIPTTDLLARDATATISSPLGLSNFSGKAVTCSVQMALSDFSTVEAATHHRWTLPGAVMHLHPTLGDGTALAAQDLPVGGQLELAHVTLATGQTWLLNLNQPSLELPHVFYAGSYQATITYTIARVP